MSVQAEGRVTCPFDHHASTYGDEFREILDRIRTVRPIVWTDSYGGFWIATSYEAVRKLAIDAETFTVAPGPDRIGGQRIPAPGLKSRPLFVPARPTVRSTTTTAWPSTPTSPRPASQRWRR